jgi:hypothetical protein
MNQWVAIDPPGAAGPAHLLNRIIRRLRSFLAGGFMSVEKRVYLALLAGLLLSGQGVAVAQKGPVGPQSAATPNVNLGLPPMAKAGASIGLPVAALAARTTPAAVPPAGPVPGQAAVPAQVAVTGAATSASSAGLTPPGLSSIPNGGAGPGQGAGNGSSAQTTAPGAAKSASSAGLAMPVQSNQPERGANDDKSDEAKEKLASLTKTSTDTTSAPAHRLNQLPTCR